MGDNAAVRNQATALDARFNVRFVERLYDGAPRWYDSAWRSEHHDDVGSGRDQRERFAREPGVKRLMSRAHTPNYLHHIDQSGSGYAYLGTCVNPDCSARVQWTATAANIDAEREESQDRAQARARIIRAVKSTVRARPADSPHVCDSCNQKQRCFAVVPVRRKWIYVLKQEGDGDLQHYCELDYQATSDGYFVHTRLNNGTYTDARSPFQGRLFLLPSPTRYNWHFFLSPVRLGHDALELLRTSPDKLTSIARARDQVHNDADSVPIDADLQPWACTVKRKFSEQFVQAALDEVVPLVDPFAWAQQLEGFDMATILAAHQKLIRDPDEQAKAFVSSALQQATALRPVPNTNPPEMTRDPHDIEDDLAAKPSALAGSNAADAWVKRYRAAVEYFTDETNKAATRLVFMLRYSLAHRIVELACQERAAESKQLAMGILHWHIVLQRMMLTAEGKRFIAWLTAPIRSNTQESADDPMAPANRIPIKNVLRGVDVRGETQAAQDLGDGGVLVMLVASLSCGAIVGNREPQDAVIEYLGNVNVNASSIKGSDIRSARDFALSIPQPIMRAVAERSPRLSALSTTLRAATGRGFADTLKLFNRMSDVDRVLTLVVTVSKLGDAPNPYDTGYDRFNRARGMVETPIKVADFLASRSQLVLRAQMTESAGALAQQLDDAGPATIRSFTTAEYELFLASRSLNAYRALGVGLQVLKGPVAIVFGGVDLVTNSMQSIDSMEAGDPGAAVGFALAAGASVMVIAVAAAECTALVTGAAAASWAGPVGWIAAGLMLISAGIIYAFSKNDLELYALHSFLGNEYGDGDWDDESGKPWLKNEPYPWLRYNRGTHHQSPQRFARQRQSLLRMMSSFRLWRSGADMEVTSGLRIYPSHFESASCYEIIVELFTDAHASNPERCKLVVWPEQRQWDRLEGDATRNYSVVFHAGSDGRLHNIAISAPTKRYHGASYQTMRDMDIRIKVRMRLDGTTRLLLPASGAWVTMDTSDDWITPIIEQASSDSTQ